MGNFVCHKCGKSVIFLTNAQQLKEKCVLQCMNHPNQCKLCKNSKMVPIRTKYNNGCLHSWVYRLMVTTKCFPSFMFGEQEHLVTHEHNDMP